MSEADQLEFLDLHNFDFGIGRDEGEGKLLNGLMLSIPKNDMAPRQNIIGLGYTLGDSWVYPPRVYPAILGIPGGGGWKARKCVKTHVFWHLGPKMPMFS